MKAEVVSRDAGVKVRIEMTQEEADHLFDVLKYIRVGEACSTETRKVFREFVCELSKGAGEVAKFIKWSRSMVRVE